jgi:hypothetical protein
VFGATETAKTGQVVELCYFSRSCFLGGKGWPGGHTAYTGAGFSVFPAADGAPEGHQVCLRGGLRRL